MISITKKEYEKEFIQKGYEQFTEDQFRKWIDLNSDILVKGEQGMLEDDIEKAEYDEFKEEIRSFTAVEVVEPSPISKFRIEKSIMYVRPKQVEWDEPEIIKGENGEDIQKARSGRYKDTSLNRKLGRVGNEYGKKSEKEEGEFKIGDKVKLEDGFDKQGKPIIREYTISKPGLRRSGEHLKEGEYYLTSPGTIGFDVTKKWLTENKISDSSNSTSEGDDKGKSEKKEEGKGKQEGKIEVGDMIPLGPNSRGSMSYGEVQSIKDDTVKVRMSGGQIMDLSMAGALHYLKAGGVKPVIEKVK